MTRPNTRPIGGHHDQLRFVHPVAQGAREACCGDLALDDVAAVIVDQGCSACGPAARRCDRRSNGIDESVAQPACCCSYQFHVLRTSSSASEWSKRQAHTDSGYARRSSMRETRWSHVPSSASPDDSCAARRADSADHNASTSFSSKLSESRLATRLEASDARSSGGSVSARSRRVSAAAVTVRILP